MSKTQIAGWVLSVLLVALLIFSALGKFTQPEDMNKMLADLGWSADVMFNVGIIEVTFAVLFLVPWTSFVGAILLTAYMGGAVASHIRVGDQFFVQIAIGVVVWVALGLRHPQVFALAFGIGEREARSKPRRDDL